MGGARIPPACLLPSPALLSPGPPPTLLPECRVQRVARSTAPPCPRSFSHLKAVCSGWRVLERWCR